MGRKTGIRRTTNQWRSLVDDQKQSGLTVEQFCKHHGLTQSNFYLWRKKLAADTPDHLIKPDSSGHAQWINVSAPAAVVGSTWDIELDLPNGVTLRMRSA